MLKRLESIIEFFLIKKIGWFLFPTHKLGKEERNSKIRGIK
jgi:hypothetical protein